MTPDLLPFEESVARVLAEARPLGSERVSLTQAAGRVLARPLLAPRDVPPEPASLMDGYAVRAADGAGPLQVAYEVAAGRTAPRPLQPGECARIFTGAVLPPGANAVVMQERATREGERVSFDVAPEAGEHVRQAGSDAKAGDELIPAGMTLDAGGVALVAAMGHPFLEVGRAPVVAILATGDELRAPGEPLSSGLIHESNSFGLSIQAHDAGASAVTLGIAPDEPEVIAARLASSGADVLVTSGGASVGDYDFARDVLHRLGGRAVFWQVAIRPGKPVLFGTIERGSTPPALFFALPGNPGASALTFDLLVRPALRAMQGALEPRRPRLIARLAHPLKVPAHLTFLARGRLKASDAGLVFESATLQGSMSIASLRGLGAVAIVPPGASHLDAGAEVSVEAWRAPDAA